MISWWQFNDSIKNAFDAFLSMRGFIHVAESDFEVDYHSSLLDTTLKFVYDELEGNLEVIFVDNSKRKPIQDGQGYIKDYITLVEVLNYLSISNRCEIIVRTEDQLTALIAEVKKILETNWNTIVPSNYQLFYYAVLSDSIYKLDQYFDDLNVNVVKNEADVAFKSKDYLKTIQLYSSIKKHLSSIELKKLALARKMIQ